MQADWLDTLLAGTLQLVLPSITLTEGDSSRFSGSGRLDWVEGQGIRVQAVTDGADLLRKRFGFGLGPVGQLIPLEKYLSASGHAQARWLATTNPVPVGGSTVGWDSPHVVWDFQTHGVSLSRDLGRSYRHPRIVRAILGPGPERWPRGSATEVHNEYFGVQSSSRSDSLFFQTSLGAVGARARSERWFEVQVGMQQSAPRLETFELLVAVARAFGFVLGQQVWIRGFEDASPNEEKRYVDARHKEIPNDALQPPLGHGIAYLANVENLLGRGVDFFLTGTGHSVGQLLHLCWDTAGSDLATRLTMVSVCLEGLIRIASREFSELCQADNSHTTEDLNAIAGWLANTSGLTDRFVKRVGGFLNALPHKRPIDVLWAWQRNGVLGISPEDIEAWELTRHPSAHAGLAGWPAEERHILQDRMTRFFRVLNLLNRIVLALMNYRGHYVDYSQPGWPETDFPSAAVGPGS